MRAGLVRGSSVGALCFALLSGCGSDAPTTDVASDTTPGRRTAHASGKSGAESVDLQALVTEVPEYEGQGRNLFAFGRTEAPRKAPPPERKPPPPAPPPKPERVERRAPPPVRVDLKFAGFVEKSAPSGEKTKYAVLLDGHEIFTGAEGDTVANRYKIVQIGLESVTVGVSGSEATQRIPLRVN